MGEVMKITTEMTQQLGIDLPIIAAPMFLVSNEEIVSKVSEFGAIGTFPALNYRPIEKYEEALKNIRRMTQKPIGVNIIVNKSNTRQNEDLKVALDQGVNLFITSLGNPKEVIKAAHQQGAKVYCDVTNLEHALKVEDLGADGVIAVGAGAGGHAGPVSPLVLIPWLKTRLQIPIIAAGGISHGSQIAASLAMGASGVSIGTRFIASVEAPVPMNYKEAVVKATPEDIVMTTKVSGTPAAVINNEYIKKQGTELNILFKLLLKNPTSKKWMVPIIHLLGMRQMESSVQKLTWKNVWSAGQSVGLVEKIMSVDEILQQLVREYDQSVSQVKPSFTE